MKHILITGGCGFIGARLARTLISSGITKISIVDNLSIGSMKAVKDLCDSKFNPVSDVAWSNDVSVHEVDIENIDKFRFLFADADLVIHLAANTGVQPSIQDPYTDMRSNVIGTLNILEAARFSERTKQVIFASSGAPLAGQNPPLYENMAPIPMSPYGASKLSGEGYCVAYNHCFGLATTVLRFSNVFGPGSISKNSIVAKAIKHALNREPIPIFGDGSQVRDFVFVDDLVEGIISCIDCTATHGEIMQVSSGVGTTINQIISMVEKEFAARGLPFYGSEYRDFKKGDALFNVSNNDKIKMLTNWSPKTPLEIGISKTVEYFVNGDNI